jgi:aspartyl-tRNA(Asn)/glutamyl-tRNA(Gln) amidotransferase subunit A
MNFTNYKNQNDPKQAAFEALDKGKMANVKLNAVITFVDPETQLEALTSIDPSAKMYGVPIVLKDNVNTKGILTTAGSRILGNYVPAYDATIAEKLRDAGAILIAKSSLDEFGMGGTNLSAATGPVYNPYDLSRMSGGSSGGSAVMVAAGVVPFAIGSDTGDSVRKPASFNGIIGYKPTYGRISRYGIIPYASSLDHVAFFTRNVHDTAVALEVLAGRDDRDMTSLDLPVPPYVKNLNGDLKGKKIGILVNVVRAITHPQIQTLFATLIDQLRAAGAEIVEIELDENLLSAILPTYYIIANAEATANHSNLDGLRFGVQLPGTDVDEVMSASRTAGFGKLIRKRFVIGSYALFVENQDKLFRKAQKVRRLIVDELKQALDKVDGLIAPASAGVAPKLGDNSLDQLSTTYLIAENFMVMGNFSGCPSITMPMGYCESLPVGVNLTCRLYDEQSTLDIALAIERCTGLADTIKEVA